MIARIALGLAMVGVASSQTLERDLGSPAPGARFGEALGPIGDLDTDGLPEVLVGAPGADGATGIDSGALFLYSGAALTGFIQNGPPAPSPVLTIEGEHAGDEFSRAVCASDEDYDGDGIEDLLVGAPGWDGVAGSDSGAVIVISGAWLRLKSQGLPAAPSGVLLVIEGQSAGERFGHVLDGNGDGNGDGVLDLAVGAPFANSELGRVDIVSGAWAQAILAGTAPPTKYLWSETGGVGPNRKYGWDLEWVGEFDGEANGADELVVGCPFDSAGQNNGGSARLYSGGAFNQIMQLFPASQIGEMGISVAGPGDMDLNGRGEVIVGAPWESPNPSPCGSSCCWFSGLVFLFHGPSGWPPQVWDAPYTVQTSGNAASCHGTHLGRSVSGCGDFDGDWAPDAVLGQPDANDPPVNGKGVVAIVRDILPQSQQLLYKSMGRSGGDHLGSTVAGVGDINGDGFVEIAATASGGEYVRFILGHPGSCTGPITSDCNGNGLDDTCDLALDLSSDCNGNGIPDECDQVLIGTISPNQGSASGGDVITITGEGFVPGATLVLFDSSPASEVTVVSPVEMQVRVPRAPRTPSGRFVGVRLRVNVTVATCVGSTTAFQGYTYLLDAR